MGVEAHVDLGCLKKKTSTEHLRYFEKKKKFINLTSIQNNKSSFQTTNAVSVQFQNIHLSAGHVNQSYSRQKQPFK